MTIQFTLKPYFGPNPVTFEMTPEEVENVLGSPEKVGINSWEEREERRGKVTIRYSKIDGKVIEVSFLPGCDLRFRQRNLFQVDNLINFLQTYDSAYECVGFLIYLKLGIMVGGFNENDESQKAIVVFREGRMDQFREKWKVFPQPSTW